jgi:hypothetical protein
MYIVCDYVKLCQYVEIKGGLFKARSMYLQYTKSCVNDNMITWYGLISVQHKQVELIGHKCKQITILTLSETTPEKWLRFTIYIYTCIKIVNKLKSSFRFISYSYVINRSFTIETTRCYQLNKT